MNTEKAELKYRLQLYRSNTMLLALPFAAILVFLIGIIFAPIVLCLLFKERSKRDTKWIETLGFSYLYVFAFWYIIPKNYYRTWEYKKKLNQEP